MKVNLENIDWPKKQKIYINILFVYKYTFYISLIEINMFWLNVIIKMIMSCDNFIKVPIIAFKDENKKI